MLITAICLVAGATLVAGLPVVAVAPVSLIGALLVGAMIAIAHFCASLPYASIDLPPPFNLPAPRRARWRLASSFADDSEGQGAHRACTCASQTRRSASQAVVCVRARLGRSPRSAPCRRRAGAAGRPAARHRPGHRPGRLDLLEGPAGGRMLIDTGPDPDLVLARLDARIPAWDRRIDVVVLTHPHEDHVGGLALLLERYRIGKVLESGHGRPRTRRRCLPTRACRAGSLDSNGGRRQIGCGSMALSSTSIGRSPARFRRAPAVMASRSTMSRS